MSEILERTPPFYKFCIPESRQQESFFEYFFRVRSENIYRFAGTSVPIFCYSQPSVKWTFQTLVRFSPSRTSKTANQIPLIPTSRRETTSCGRNRFSIGTLFEIPNKIVTLGLEIIKIPTTVVPFGCQSVSSVLRIWLYGVDGNFRIIKMYVSKRPHFQLDAIGLRHRGKGDSLTIIRRLTRPLWRVLNLSIHAVTNHTNVVIFCRNRSVHVVVPRKNVIITLCAARFQKHNRHNQNTISANSLWFQDERKLHMARNRNITCDCNFTEHNTPRCWYMYCDLCVW